MIKQITKYYILLYTILYVETSLNATPTKSKTPLPRKLYPKAPLSFASLEKPARKPPRNQV